MKTLFSNSAFTKSSIFVFSLMFANAMNFIFNAYLGRVLSFSDYGLVILISSLWNLISIPIATLGGTTSYSVAFLTGKNEHSTASHFFSYVKRNSFFIFGGISLVWLLLSPFIASYFQVNDIFAIASLSPIILLGALMYLNRGFLQGNVFFELVAITIFVEVGVKLFAAFSFVIAGIPSLSYLSILISILFAYLISRVLVFPKIIKVLSPTAYAFPRKFFFLSLLSSFSSAAFLTVDVILVKHFFSPEIAGQYALLSLVGKMVYFLGSLLNGIIFTYISRESGKEKKRSIKLFYQLFSLSAAMTIAAFILLGPLGSFLVPILFGNKAVNILAYLSVYTGAMTLFTIASIVVSYHLIYKEYIFTYISLACAMIMSLGIYLFHQSLSQVSYVIFISSVLNFVAIVSVHIVYRAKRIIV
jgi:O-antigen/teichoic acid export membrane protein